MAGVGFLLTEGTERGKVTESQVQCCTFQEMKGRSLRACVCPGVKSRDAAVDFLQKGVHEFTERAAHLAAELIYLCPIDHPRSPKLPRQCGRKILCERLSRESQSEQFESSIFVRLQQSNQSRVQLGCPVLYLSRTRPDSSSNLTGVVASAINKVLIVDDSRAQRILVQNGLRGHGFTVLQAESGDEALSICAREDIDLVLSDWMMPGLSGIEFCRALRSMPSDRYVYFILLTSKSDKAAVAEGLDVGADDFLAKPVDSGELRARIRAGDRVLAMERALRGNNQLLTDTLAKLQSVYETLDRDLIEARNLQQSLLRERQHQYPEGQISLLLHPSGPVGGDMVGYFDIAPGLTGLYAFDVSGHGVTSALLTARLSGLLSGSSPDHNIGIDRGVLGPEARAPADVAATMNALLLSEVQTDRYLTLAYATIDRSNGRVRLVQAGHPHPVVQRSTGEVSVLGTGGLPIGLFEGAAYEGFDAQLNPGDRLLLVSDGVTECPNPQGEELGDEGLAAILTQLADRPGRPMLDDLIWELARWHGSEDFPDDISCALFEYR